MTEELINQLTSLKQTLFEAQQKLSHGFKHTNPQLETDLEKLIHNVTTEIEKARKEIQS